jgi:hypothetical protein
MRLDVFKPTFGVWKKLLAIVLIVALNQHKSASAASAVAISDENTAYYATRSTVKAASKSVIDYCVREGGSNCRVIHSNRRRGYGAVVQTNNNNFLVATGQSTPEEAAGKVFDNCKKYFPTDRVCTLIIIFKD